MAYRARDQRSNVEPVSLGLVEAAQGKLPRVKPPLGHRGILKALKARDSVKARAEMLEHLRLAEIELRAFLG
jgi:DNA-binding GntR family transcriptional regulator